MDRISDRYHFFPTGPEDGDDGMVSSSSSIDVETNSSLLSRMKSSLVSSGLRSFFSAPSYQAVPHNASQDRNSLPNSIRANRYGPQTMSNLSSNSSLASVQSDAASKADFHHHSHQSHLRSATSQDSERESFVIQPLSPSSTLVDSCRGTSSTSSISSNCFSVSRSLDACTSESSGHDRRRCFTWFNEHELTDEDHLHEIKEGKKPEKPVDYDTLLADITNDQIIMPETPAQEDDGEWIGLEYTLELSREDGRPSDCHTPNAGEHSKSHASWAAIHQSVVDSSYADEEYIQWRNWRQHLDKQEEKRKIKRAVEFEEHSYDLALLYLEERNLRDWVSSQQGEIGTVWDMKHIKEHLSLLCKYRADPYFPPKKHNLAWRLKRSRSCACIRELRLAPEFD